MRVIYSESHSKHSPINEMVMGNFGAYRESPSRALAILQSCKNNNMVIIAPIDFGLDPILAIHSKEYVEYLKSAYKNWVEIGGNPHG
jgi:acetoin utilization deacetylase AcuC-like enzyme